MRGMSLMPSKLTFIGDQFKVTEAVFGPGPSKLLMYQC